MIDDDDDGDLDDSDIGSEPWSDAPENANDAGYPADPGDY